MSAIPEFEDIKVINPSFTPKQIKILKMCLADDDRVCSFYAKEIFDCINFADVYRKQIRMKLARVLSLDFEFVRDVVTKADKRIIIKADGTEIETDIYRIDKRWKSKVRSLLPKDESQRSN